MADVVLEVNGLTKRFEGVTAVDHVSFTVGPGELVGLIGQNGSGKSTILKMLAGYHRPDEGSFRIGEKERGVDGGDSRNSVAAGFVHQDLGLVLSLSVTENLALGRGYPRRWGAFIDWPKANAEARAVLEEYGIDAEPATLVRDLSLADQALLAIGRGLGVVDEAQTPLLVLDEPTSSLPEDEVEIVLSGLRRIVDQGGSVIFVSHRLDEILQVATRVLVMRDGRLVADRPRAGLTHDDLVTSMLGREFDRIVSRPPEVKRDEIRLEVRHLSGHLLRDFSASVAAGEIVGVTGLLGSGKSELGRLLAGAKVPVAGQILVDGEAVTFTSPRDAIRAGIGYVPPDRHTEGGIPGMTATENLTLPDLGSFLRPLSRLLDQEAERKATLDWMERAQVVPPEPPRRFATFSGGNQQKLVYGRWIRLSPRILVLDEPTRGVDVGAVGDLYEIIRAQAERGAAVLLMSSEWEELPAICQRVIVLDRGRSIAELSQPEVTVDSIAAVALGHSVEEASDEQVSLP